ncbi:MAG: hypothetical protein JXB49_37035 [Bacteroidales bacterium]|nr:hypothetical protein [Bacteroidales bacterium]
MKQLTILLFAAVFYHHVDAQVFVDKFDKPDTSRHFYCGNSIIEKPEKFYEIGNGKMSVNNKDKAKTMYILYNNAIDPDSIIEIYTQIELLKGSGSIGIYTGLRCYNFVIHPYGKWENPDCFRGHFYNKVDDIPENELDTKNSRFFDIYVSIRKFSATENEIEIRVNGKDLGYGIFEKMDKNIEQGFIIPPSTEAVIHSFKLDAFFMNQYNPDDLVTKGIMLVGLKKFNDAREVFEKSLKLKPENGLAWHCLAECLLRLNEFEHVCEYYDNAIKCNFSISIERKEIVCNEMEYFSTGYKLLKQSSYNEALKEFNKAQTANPDFGKIYVYRSICYMYLDENEKALQDMDKAMKYEENKYFMDTLYFVRSLVNTNRNYILAAIDDLTKCTELNPEYGLAYRNRGILYIKEKEFNKAYEDLNRYLSDYDKKDEFANYGMGRVKYAKGDYHDAVLYFNTGLQPQPAYQKDYYYYRGQAYLYQYKYEQGCNDIRKAKDMGHEGAIIVFKDKCMEYR